MRDDAVERELAGGAEFNEPRNIEMRHGIAAMVSTLLKWIGSVEIVTFSLGTPPARRSRPDG